MRVIRRAKKKNFFTTAKRRFKRDLFVKYIYLLFIIICKNVVGSREHRISRILLCACMWWRRRRTTQKRTIRKPACSCNIGYFSFYDGASLFFPFSGSEAYLLFNSNISQLSINIETDNKQKFFSLFFCVLDGEDPHFMCWSRSRISIDP